MGDPPDTPPPRLDHPGPEERIGDPGVVGSRRMLPGELFHGPIRRQLSGIPQHDPVVVHADLDGGRTGVIPMDHGVDHRLAHGFVRHGEGLHSIDPIIGNQRLGIFGVEKVHRSVHLRKQVPFDDVLVQQLGAAKIADLDVGFPHEAPRSRVEKQHRGPLQVLSFPQAELFDHPGIGFVQDVLRQPFAVRGAAAEALQRAPVQVLEADPRHGHIVPGLSVLLQQEAAQRRAPKHLLGAAAPVVEFAPVADRVGMRIDDDFQVFHAAFRLEVHFHDDAEKRLNLVGDLFEELEDVLHSNGFAPVVPADLQHAALRIGEPADPLQVLVTPRPLPFDVLVFVHGFDVANTAFPLAVSRYFCKGLLGLSGRVISSSPLSRSRSSRLLKSPVRRG